MKSKIKVGQMLGLGLLLLGRCYLDTLLIFSTFFLNSERKKQYGQIAKFEIPIKTTVKHNNFT